MVRDRDVIRDRSVAGADMGSTRYKRAVGVFARKEDTEGALRALKDNGFNMDNVSLIARDLDNVKGADEVTDTEGNNAPEGAGAGATTGAVLGGLGGFLVGAGMLAIPGIGPVLAAGAGISEIAATLAGAGIGAAAGGIIGALVGLGIPEEKAKVYEDRVKAGEYLMMVVGTEDEVNRAESLLRDRHIQEFEIFDAPDFKGGTTPAVNQVETVETVDTVRKPVTEGRVVETRDIDRDADPEVIIVDKRDNVADKRGDVL